jgi:hypothetical protein
MQNLRVYKFDKVVHPIIAEGPSSFDGHEIPGRGYYVYKTARHDSSFADLREKINRDSKGKLRCHHVEASVFSVINHGEVTEVKLCKAARYNEMWTAAFRVIQTNKLIADTADLTGKVEVFELLAAHGIVERILPPPHVFELEEDTYEIIL